MVVSRKHGAFDSWDRGTRGPCGLDRLGLRPRVVSDAVGAVGVPRPVILTELPHTWWHSVASQLLAELEQSLYVEDGLRPELVQVLKLYAELS